jgi:hypothetical protein
MAMTSQSTKIALAISLPFGLAMSAVFAWQHGALIGIPAGGSE